MFKNIERPNKRYVQEQLTWSLVDCKPESYVPGTVLMLCGPSPAAAIKYYNESNLCRSYFCAEKDPDTFNKAQFEWRFGYIGGVLKRVDIFDLARDIANKKYILKYPICGFDFDFCNTLDEYNINGICDSINVLSAAKLLGNSFWIRITSNLRKIGTKNTHNEIEKIKNSIIKSTGLSPISEKVASYKVGMHVWQAYFTPQCYTVAKERPMKKYIRGKTMKDLSATDKMMVQILAQNTKPGLEITDIAKRFGLGKGSIAALKAWQTMKQ